MKEDKTKHTLFLRAGDMDFLCDLMRPKGVSGSSVIRTVISRYVDQLRARDKPLEELKLEADLDD